MPEEKAELLARAPNVKTVPQVFINNKHVGGYEDLLDYFDDYFITINI